MATANVSRLAFDPKANYLNHRLASSLKWSGGKAWAKGVLMTNLISHILCLDDSEFRTDNVKEWWLQPKNRERP